MNNRRDTFPRRSFFDRRRGDRRTELRELVDCSVRFVRAGTPIREILHGELLDASTTGIRLLLKDHLERRDRILVEVKSEGHRCFSMTAQVVWVEQEPTGRYRIGCELRVPLTKRQLAMFELVSRAAVPA